MISARNKRRGLDMEEKDPTFRKIVSTFKSKRIILQNELYAMLIEIDAFDLARLVVIREHGRSYLCDIKKEMRGTFDTFPSTRCKTEAIQFTVPLKDFVISCSRRNNE